MDFIKYIFPEKEQCNAFNVFTRKKIILRNLGNLQFTIILYLDCGIKKNIFNLISYWNLTLCYKHSDAHCLYSNSQCIFNGYGVILK